LFDYQGVVRINIWIEEPAGIGPPSQGGSSSGSYGKEGGELGDGELFACLVKVGFAMGFL
jgi:hypothetical protein